ncbi:MAG: redox-sensing transcriptional repressor Rex [Candidatus Omnitrophica bacterium]|nr:redox-sensing transcriptional repressor Rex [Candidatus Omnitrophota bacterium]
MSKRTIIRLSKYKNALYRLKKMGFVKVFSDNLADAVGVTPAQVRKDFSMFGISGNKRGGYTVAELVEKLNKILGKDKVQDVIVVGTGHIGTAMMNYRGFEKENIRIVAGFDIDPAKYNADEKIPVLQLDKMRGYVKEHGIRVGIIAVPDIAAQQVLEIMVSAGIKGILNFAPINLKGEEDTVINNVNLGLELENIIYFINTDKKGVINEDTDA